MIKWFTLQGPLAFYKGFLPNFARLGSWNVIMFLTLEQVNENEPPALSLSLHHIFSRVEVFELVKSNINTLFVDLVRFKSFL
jgi:hypothetical protein